MTQLSYFNTPGIDPTLRLPNDPPQPDSNGIFEFINKVLTVFKPKEPVKTAPPQPQAISDNMKIALIVVAAIVLIMLFK